MNARPAVLLLLLAALGSCSEEPGAGAPEAGPEAERSPSPAQGVAFAPLADSPIAYFEDHCARCHGPHGSFYGEAFARVESDRQMHGVVLEMVQGPANAPIDEPSLFALVAFHRSLRDGTPFGVVTSWDAGAMAGEMTPGTTVSVVAGERVIQAEMDEATWRVEARETDLTRARVRIMRGGRVFEWSPREQAWSDAPPPTLEDV